VFAGIMLHYGIFKVIYATVEFIMWCFSDQGYMCDIPQATLSISHSSDYNLRVCTPLSNFIAVGIVKIGIW
jgi:hypothetical protein